MKQNCTHSNKLRKLGLVKTINLVEKLGDCLNIENMMLGIDDLSDPKFYNSIVNPKTKIFANRFVNYDFDAKIYNVKDEQINTIVLHTTSVETVNSAINLYHKYGVSAHFIIDLDGIINLLIPLEFTAFHAGTSYFSKFSKIGIDGYGVENIASLNPVSIGIEFLTPDYNFLTDKQIDNFYKLLENLRIIYPNIKNIISHSTIAPYRKVDPSCIALICFNKERLDSFNYFPKKCDDSSHHADLINCFKSLESGNKTTHNVWYYVEIMEIIGYNFYQNGIPFLDLFTSNLFDYIKQIEPEFFIKRSYLRETLNNIRENQIFQYYKQNMASNISLSEGLIKHRNLSSEILDIAICVNQDFVNMTKQMNLKKDFYENLDKIKDENIAIANFIAKAREFNIDWFK